MSCVAKMIDDELVVEINENLDTSSVDRIGEEIISIVDENKAESLTLDVKNMEYISSAGLRLLIRIKKGGVDLKVINSSKDVYDIFHITGFTDMFDIEKPDYETL